MSEVEFPVDEARRMLIAAAEKAGYPNELAEQLVASALWLEERKTSGVLQLSGYLLSTSGMSFEDRSPTRDPTYEFRCLCPVMAANVLVNIMDEQGLPNQTVALQGPAAPWLMAPTLTGYAASKGHALQLSYVDVEVKYAPNGFEFLSNNLALYSMVDTELRHPTGVTFIDPFDHREPDALTSISFPKARLTENNELDFQERKLH